jgi:hypothetical protein
MTTPALTWTPTFNFFPDLPALKEGQPSFRAGKSGKKLMMKVADFFCGRFAGFILIAAMLVGLDGYAQKPMLSRHMGGNYLLDRVYQIDLFNPSSKAINIGGYMLITRQFVVRLPAGTRIGGKSSFVLGKGSKPEGGMPDLRFEAIKDFLVRIPRETQSGDYLVLLDRNKKIVDAFYYAPSRRVAFLPDSDTLITFSQRKIPFSIPSEADPQWQYLSLRSDPALAFMRVDGRWLAGSRRRNTFPATAYATLEGSFVDGVITVRVETQFEKDALRHRLERSEDGKNFSVIEQFDAKQAPTQYRIYDPQVVEGARYYYRVSHEDRFGFVIRSRLVEVRAERSDAGVSLEAFVSNAGMLNVRLFTPKKQPIRLKVLDEQRREWALRYYDDLQAGGRYLLRFEEQIPQGRYYIIAITPDRRYYQDIMVVK